MMEIQELWDKLPAIIESDGTSFRLNTMKCVGFTLVRYECFLPGCGDYYLHYESCKTLHEALDKMWLWWQDYEVKK